MDPFIDGSELKDIVSIDDKNNARPITEETKAEAAVVCSHLILAYTVRLAIMNAIELERNGCCYFFFLPSLRKCCVVIEKNVDKKACKSN